MSVLCLCSECHGWDGGAELRASVIQAQHRAPVQRLTSCFCASCFPVREYRGKERQMKNNWQMKCHCLEWLWIFYCEKSNLYGHCALRLNIVTGSSTQ